MAGFAGTLFALVLAARQVRGRLDEDPAPAVSRALLFDSIGVTVELGAAACLGLLYGIRGSHLFCFAVVAVALAGVALSCLSATFYLVAFRSGHFGNTWKARLGPYAQAAGNILPLACYVVVSLYGFRIIRFDDHSEWGYAAAVSWLVVSGVFQAIYWYARIWETKKPGTGA